MNDRKQLIQYCIDNNIAYRTKDGTGDIKKKIIKAMSTTEVKTVVTTSSTPKPAVPKKEIAEVVKSLADVIPPKFIIEPRAKYKQIGNNVILVLDGKQYTKKEESKDIRESIKKLVDNINSGDNHAVDKIVDIFAKKTEAIKVKVESGLSLESVAASVAALAEQMNKMMQIMTGEKPKAEEAAKEAPKTEAPVSNRSGEKPYR